jgi:hypothetical protein
MPRNPTAVLLDANLLLLMSVGAYDRALIGQKRLKGFTPYDYDVLLEMIGGYRANLTTPHLLSEVSNLSDQCVPRKRHWQFRAFLGQLWLGFDERWMTLSELSKTQAFLQLGLTDAAVCQLTDEQTLVISVDDELCSVLWSLGLNALNFNRDR